MPRFFYTVLLCVLVPLLVLRQLWRGRGEANARAALQARFGFVAPVSGRPVWLHCVSVGEAVAAEPLIAALGAQGLPLLVTSTTFTGAARVQSRSGDAVAHRFMPFDTPGAVARFLARVQPRMLVILETELWPNLLRACRQRNIPVLLVNARLSERSARGYARFAALTQPMLNDLTAIAAQTPADAGRFQALGMPESRLHVTGNLKFDIDVDADARQAAGELRTCIGARPVWIAASTHDGEDEIILTAHRQLLRDFPDALLVLVPRHPERFDAVAALIARHGFASAARDDKRMPDASVSVYFGNTMGEMALLYGIADVAFVGGSLVPVGGHNFLEPAAIGLPLLAGVHCFNFQGIADDLTAAGALARVMDADGLALAVGGLLRDESKRTAAGRAAQAYVEKNRGACTRTITLIRSAMIQTAR